MWSLRHISIREKSAKEHFHQTIVVAKSHSTAQTVYARFTWLMLRSPTAQVRNRSHIRTRAGCNEQWKRFGDPPAEEDRWMAKEVRWLRVSMRWSFFQQANVNGAGTGASDHEDWCRFLGRRMCCCLPSELTGGSLRCLFCMGWLSGGEGRVKWSVLFCERSVYSFIDCMWLLEARVDTPRVSIRMADATAGLLQATYAVISTNPYIE